MDAEPAEAKTIHVERKGAVDWLTLNRPERLNTITGTMVRELCGYFDGLRNDYDARIVVMRGAGRAFCAGLDIKEHMGGDRVPETAGRQTPGYHVFDIVRLMRACPQPIVALVHGPACGGGFAMALAADIRIAGETARMNDAFVTFGRSGCELGLSYFLPRIVGLGIAAELMYAGAFIEAQRAKEVGLISRVVADDALDRAAAEYVEAMLRTAPLGLRMTKQTLNTVLNVNDLSAVIDLEERAQSICGRGPDFEEAMRAFMEKRPPAIRSRVMAHAFDLIVRGGTIADGTGGEPFEADIAIKDGKIARIGTVNGSAAEEIDAKGLLVTPGFVDIHTHYDGQAIWSERLSPSSSHGVTTVVAGNCGVGFAPCRASDHELLVRVMEGVEDIPEIVMTEGLNWDWETFPDYLDALDRHPHDIDIATQLPHSALRVYVMGERGAAREPATAEDRAAMHKIASEAIRAGALGFAGDIAAFIHRTRDGDPIPSYEAAEAELQAIADALKSLQRGVLQFVLGSPSVAFSEEIALLARIAHSSGRPASFSLGQDPANPQSWRAALAQVARANENGCQIRAQIFPRPIGLFVSHNLSVNPFCLCPSYQPLVKLDLAARMRELRRPDVRARLIAETPLNPVSSLALMGRKFDLMFPVPDRPDYEPPPDRSIANQARQRGIRPEELAYDLLLENDGQAMLYVALANYAEGSLDAVYDMLRDPNTVLGLGHGGAHYGMISDASYPTFLLSHWTRDRIGNKLSLPWAVRALSREPAGVVGLEDRGVLLPGFKADLNILDYDKLNLLRPHVVNDLPAGGRRLMQDADGFIATIVSGTPILREGQPTGATPGRLVRGAKRTIVI